MTELNADLASPAYVDGAGVPWDPSPVAGVLRRRIERVGDEVARATSVVRYEAGSSFPTHVHGGGEELFVLSGTFSDEHGAFGAGTWLRNGVGSAHAPSSADGCDLLVKLWWMHPGERENHRVDTTDEQAWRPAAFGARCALHKGAHDVTELLRVDPHKRAIVFAEGGVELFVIGGDAVVDGEAGGRLSWWRRPSGVVTVAAGAEAATVYVKRGHLASPPPLPTPDA